MSGIFFTSPLVKSASNGAAWTQVDAYFPTLQVFANVLLSAYRTQTPGSFSGFQPSWAEAWIVTPQTPMIPVGPILVPARRDNTVYVLTDRLTFWLQVSNGSSTNPPTSASAVGVIYDTTPAAAFELVSAERQLALAVHTDDGTVIGTHRSFQLAGGPGFDDEKVRAQVLADAYVRSGREPGSLEIASFGYDEMPVSVDFRLNPSTGKPEPLPDVADLLGP
jgi:hypothetical protein